MAPLIKISVYTHGLVAVVVVFVGRKQNLAV